MTSGHFAFSLQKLPSAATHTRSWNFINWMFEFVRIQWSSFLVSVFARSENCCVSSSLKYLYLSSIISLLHDIEYDWFHKIIRSDFNWFNFNWYKSMDIHHGSQFYSARDGFRFASRYVRVRGRPRRTGFRKFSHHVLAELLSSIVIRDCSDLLHCGSLTTAKRQFTIGRNWKISCSTCICIWRRRRKCNRAIWLLSSVLIPCCSFFRDHWKNVFFSFEIFRVHALYGTLFPNKISVRNENWQKTIMYTCF